MKSCTASYWISQTWSTDEEAVKNLAGISTIVCKADTLHCDFSAYFLEDFRGWPFE